MRLLRGLGGAVLWILASLLGLVGVLLCVTVILLPVGVPLMKLAGQLFTRSLQLMLPRALAHPVNEVAKAVEKKDRKITKAADKENRRIRAAASHKASDTAKSARKFTRKMRKRVS
jgi:hypothetical protein